MKSKKICDQGYRTIGQDLNLVDVGDSTHRLRLHNVVGQGKGTGDTGLFQTPNCSTLEAMPDVQGRNWGIRGTCKSLVIEG